MTDDIVLSVAKLGFPWQTLDPFLFCVHHLDAYPAGNERMGLDREQLRGRNIGQDFSGKDGFSMYHGSEVPGFPRHPHRGFETVTLARQGFIDHTDSLGAAARFGQGDVQWMTAGKGVVHSEMFPLVHREKPNTTELFQIWLNLPRAAKKEDAYFTMLWSEQIPRETLVDDAGRETELVIVAGTYGEHQPLQPPPSSWASRPESEVAIWTLRMEPGARVTLSASSEGVNRVLYVFAGDSVTIGSKAISPGHAAQVRPDVAVTVDNGAEEGELLLLQGRPIGEPVVQHGPFVMSTQGEIRQTMIEYQQSGFGGWPWPSDTPVHPRDESRFAIHADGREERPAG